LAQASRCEHPFRAMGACCTKRRTSVVSRGQETLEVVNINAPYRLEAERKMSGVEEQWAHRLEERSLKNRAAHWGCELVKAPVEVRCSFCGHRCPALPMNRPCRHSACADCWARHAENSLPVKLASCLNEPGEAEVPCIQCIGDECTESMSWPLLYVCGRYSERLLCSLTLCDKDIMAQEMKRLYRNMPQGPLHSLDLSMLSRCGICLEQCFVTMSNSCGHHACLSCWADWVGSQVRCDIYGRCNLLTRYSCSQTLPCFGHRCDQSISVSLWRHLCEESVELAEFNMQMARRRNLENNTLFPSELQMECPLPDCYGLGYLGFDSVMCFVCEHQWLPADPGNAPCDINLEELMGMKVKRCPKCTEYIEKNGGCDHMTCRCKYQFYWSSLQPYKR